MPGPTPKFRPGGPQRPDEATLFTDRDELRAAFDEALAGLKTDAPRVMVFYGPGGIGKSALRRELIRRLEAVPHKGIAWAAAQLDGEMRPEPDEVLAALAAGFAKTGKVSFPAFEVAAAVYWKKKFPHLAQTSKKAEIPFLKESKLFLGVAAAFVPGLSLANVILGLAKDVHASYGDRIRLWWDARGRDYLRGLEYEEPDGILEKLPAYFGVDLTAWAKNDRRPVVFLDGYEGVWGSETTARLRDDEWVRELVASAPGTLFVIASRRPLRWDQLGDEAWAACLDQRLVTELAEEQTTELLRKAGVTDAAVAAAITAGAGGSPVYADLAIDIFYRLQAAGKTPTPADFPAGHQAIFERFIRDLDAAERATLEVVSAARYFDRDVFQALVTAFGTGYPATYFKNFAGFSFVAAGDFPDTYRVHDLLRRQLRAYMDADLKTRVHKFLWEYYDRRAAVDDFTQVNEGGMRALVEAAYHAVEATDLAAVIEWAQQSFYFYYRAGYFADLERIYTAFAERAEATLAPGDPLVASCLRQLATIYDEQGRYDEAEALYLRAYPILEKALGPDHTAVAVLRNNLGNLYTHRGRYLEAEEHFRHACRVFQSIYPKYRHTYGIALHNLADIYTNLGRYDEAEGYAHQAIAILEEAGDEAKPDLAAATRGLATLARDRGRYAEAEPLYRRGLDLTDRTLGPASDEHFTASYELAGLYARQGEFARAETIYREAVAALEKNLGPGHPRLGKPLDQLAVICRFQERFAEAEELNRRVLAIFETVRVRDSRETAAAMTNLADLYQTQGRYAEAEPLFREAVAVYRKALGPSHPDLAHALNSFSALYGTQGRYAEGEALVREALAIRERALGPDHPLVARAYDNLGITFENMGRYEEAEKALLRCRDIRLKTLGPDHLEYGWVLHDLGTVYHGRGRLDEAAAAFTQALAIAERTAGPDHSEAGNTRCKLAAVLRDQGRLAEAEEQFKLGLPILERALGAEHVEVAKALVAYGRLCGLAGRYDEGIALAERGRAVAAALFPADHPDVVAGAKALAELAERAGRTADKTGEGFK